MFPGDIHYVSMILDEDLVFPGLVVYQRFVCLALGGQV